MAEGSDAAGKVAAQDAADLPFRQLAQHLSTPCWISDAEGQIIWVNDAWLDYTGASVGKIAAEGLKSLHDPAVYGDVVRKWMEVKAAGEPYEMVFPLRGRDGTLRPFRTRVVPLRDPSGEVTRWFGTNTDISAQSEIEARLRTREEQWREVFERAGDAVFITDVEGRLVEVNPAACAMTGYSRDELVARTVWSLIDPFEHEALAGARRSQESARDWRLTRKDGTTLAIEVTSRLLSDGRRLGVARDVSARREAEQTERARAADAERRLQRFWDASRDLYAIVDAADGKPRFINARAWAQTLGYPAERILSTRLMDLVHPDDRERTATMRTDTAGEPGYFGFENRYLRADGAIVWLSWNVVRDGGMIFCSARDITEEKRAQSDLARANARLAQVQKMEAIGQLTGGVAHDFNNLLMVMGGQAELLRARVDGDARATRSLDAISEAAMRGQALTRHLLAFSRRQRLKPTPTLLAARIAQLQPLLASSLGSGIQIEVSCQDDLWTVEVDVGEWEAAMLNMVVNARDAMPKGGRLSIAARNVTLDEDGEAEDRLAGDFVELAVEDTGEGIPADILPKVVDPFFTTKEVNKGTGLGLSQVDGFVTQSGGRLRIDSRLGAGTRICILLPRVAAHPAQAPQPGPPGAPRRLLLLCVEDNPEVADVTAGLLEQLGHEVELVGSAAAALERLEQGLAPDLLFSDIVMAGELNGLALARRVRGRWPDLPVLLVTGYSREAEAIVNEFPVLAKPYQLGDLSAALQAAASSAAAPGAPAMATSPPAA